MKTLMEPFQCRGTEGKLAKDVGVVIVPSKKYIDCNVEINCPHYTKHSLRPGQSARLEKDAGHCKTSGKICLYDQLEL